MQTRGVIAAADELSANETRAETVRAAGDLRQRLLIRIAVTYLIQLEHARMNWIRRKRAFGFRAVRTIRLTEDHHGVIRDQRASLIGNGHDRHKTTHKTTELQVRTEAQSIDHQMKNVRRGD